MSPSLQSHFSSARRLGRAGCIAFLSGLLLVSPCAIPPVQAQSASTLEQLKASLQRARDLLTASERLLAQQTTDIASLKARLDQAAAELSASRSEVESLKNDLSRAAQSQGALGDRLERLQTTYDELIRKYEALSTSFSRYRSEMTGQIQSLQSERDAAVRSGRLARTAAIAELVLLLALGGAMAVGSLQLR